MSDVKPEPRPGLPEEPCPATDATIGCAPTMADLAAVRAERDAALRDAGEQRKRVDKLDALVAWVTKDRDSLAFKVCDFDNHLKGAISRAEKAEAQRDAYLDGREMQRARAEKAERDRDEARRITLTSSAPMCDQPHAADLALKMLEATKANARILAAGGTMADASRAWLAGMGEDSIPPALSAPPAPGLDALTAAEVTYVRAAISFHAATAGFSGVLEAAKRAAKGA